MQAFYNKIKGVLMKKIMFMFLSFILIINTVGAFCAKDPSGQWKCYTTGCKVGDYWRSGFYDFSVWVEGSRIFRIGEPTRINLYIRNEGCDNDKYTVTHSILGSVLVDFPSPFETDTISATGGISSGTGETKTYYPEIKVLSSSPAQVNFTVTSQGNSTLPPKTATLDILESDYYLSLPEFNLLAMFVMVVLAAVVFGAFKNNP